MLHHLLLLLLVAHCLCDLRLLRSGGSILLGGCLWPLRKKEQVWFESCYVSGGKVGRVGINGVKVFDMVMVF